MIEERTHGADSAIDDELPETLTTFIVTCTARATIRERWLISARDEDHARAIMDDEEEGHKENLSPDETIGDEEDRQIETVEEHVPDEPAPDHRAPQLAAAVGELIQHQRQLDTDGVEVGVSREALDILLAAIAEVRPTDVESATLRDSLTQMADSAMRMELVLRLIRIYAMGDVLLQESGMVRDWLRDWIDGNHHGPLGGPLLWPGAIGSAARQLVAWGFTRSEGNPGYVVLLRAPAEGEKVQ